MVTDRYAKLGMIGAIVAIGVAMQLAGAQASLDFTRVHLVDSGTSPNGQSNWLFRGNSACTARRLAPVRLPAC